MTLAQFLPWHTEVARTWLGQRERFAHAWLLQGQAGIGKRSFAHAAAASLLCESPHNGVACTTCAACIWLACDHHPDLRRIRCESLALQEGVQSVSTAGQSLEEGPAPAKRTASKEIRIEQIRALQPWFNTATHRGGWRVAVLYYAQSLNGMAAHALLKVLEEPPPNTVFLLVTDTPDRLLPTLVSRCRRLPLPAPERVQSLAWLQAQGVQVPAQWLDAAGGAPLIALRLAQSGDSTYPQWFTQLLGPLARGQAPDLGALTEVLEKTPAPAWIDALQRLYTDLVFAAVAAPVRYFPALATEIAPLAARANRVHLLETARWLNQQRTWAIHPLNAKLFVHTALLRIVRSCLV